MKQKSLLLTLLLALGMGGARAEDTIRVFSFSDSDMAGINYGLSCILSSSDMVDDTMTMGSAHTVAYSSNNVWTRIADSALFADNYATTYPNTSRYVAPSYILSRLGVARNPGTQDDGFMFFTYCEQTSRVGNFNTYFTLPAVPTPTNTQVVEVRFTQAYYKYYDRCFIDYKIGNNWYAREINVTGIDCEVNGSATYHPSYTMPATLANENNIEIRFRAVSSTARGSIYGYMWAIDNVAIVSGNPDQWTFGPEHFLDGKYGVVPQGMQVPLTWYTTVSNTGVNAQTGVNVSMTHTNPTGTASTFLQQSFPNLAPNATSYETLDINPRGLYQTEYSINYPGFWYNPMGTGSSIPTAVPGLQSVQTTVSSASLSHTFAPYTYRVSTADITESYAWGHGNGVLVGGMDGFCYGYANNGYISNSSSDSYYSSLGHMVLVRLATGSTVPTDQQGNPWCIRGVEMTVAPGIDAEGTLIEPKLYQYKYDAATDQTLFTEIATGALSHTVSANELNTLDTGYLLPGQYNTIRIDFSAQPTLEPGGIYYIGYRLPDEANFALANTYESYKTNPQAGGSTTTVQFADNPQLAPYANTFKPDANDVFVYAYNPVYGDWRWIYGGYNIHSWPMINMQVGPMQTMPVNNIVFNCPSDGARVSDVSGNSFCNSVFSAAVGSSYRFTVRSELGYRLDSVRINGVPVDPYDFEEYSEALRDSDFNVVDIKKYSTYNLIFENITSPQLVEVFTSPYPSRNVTINCPDGVSVSASVATADNYYSLYQVCGSHNYIYDGTFAYTIYLPDSVMVDYLLVDGDTVRISDNHFYLTVGNSDHVVDFVLRTQQTETATFINEGGGYMYVLFGDAEQRVYDSVQLSGNMQTSGHVQMATFLPTSGYFGQFCDSTNSTLLHFYVDGVEIPLSSLDVYDYTEEDGYIFYSYSYQLDTSHTFRAVYGPASDSLCIAPYAVIASSITDSTARISWSGYADNYHLVLQQLDANNNVIASSASTIASRATTLTSLLPGTNYRVLVASICGSDTTDVASTTFTTTTTVTITLQNPDDGQMYYTVNNNDFFRVTGSDALTYNTGSASSFQIICYSDLPDGQYYGTDSDTSVARLTHLFVDGISIPVYADTTIAAGSFTVTMGSDYYTHVFTPTPTSSCTILARFGSWYDSIPAHVPDTFTVAATASDTSMGTVLGAGRYTEGSIATLTAIPAPCHLFNGWSDGVVDNPRSLTVSADTAITALFAPVATAFGGETATACDSFAWNGQTCTASGTYTFATSTVAGCDSIATLSLTLNYSVADTLEATATESYDWNGQTYTESGAYTYSGTTAHGCDSTVTLLLTIEPPVVYYTVTVASSDDAMGSVLGGGTYEAGTEVTLTATPAEGYEFVQWNDGLADNPRTFVLTSDTAFTAQFQPEVGIGDVDATTVTLHPNPATTTVTLAGLEPGATVTIVDMNGREISKFKIQNSEFEIDVTSLASGTYFVRIAGERQTAVRKLIVK